MFYLSFDKTELLKIIMMITMIYLRLVRLKFKINYVITLLIIISNNCNY